MPDPMLDGLRRETEARMESRCEISRVTGQTFDDGTGEYTQTIELRNPSTGVFEQRQVGTDYDHRCLVRVDTTQDRVTEVGEELVTLRLYTALFEHGVTGVEVGDVVTVTSSPDTEMSGKALRVRDFPGDDWHVAREVLCEEQV